MWIHKLTFEQVAEVWRDHLWPGRQDIEPYSAIKYGTQPYQYDLSYQNEPPSFFGAYVKGELAGVNSGHGTGQGYRSRGLYVFPQFRGKGAGQALLHAAIAQAAAEDKCFVWSIPRRSSLPTYNAAGFRQDSEWFGTETSDANCYAVVSPHTYLLYALDR